MNEFFKNTNPAMRFMTNVANLILVNLLFLITSVPIITIGASLTSLYKITFEILDGEEVFVFRDYFTTFIKKFLKATAVWIPLLVVDAIMAYSMIIVNSGLEGTAKWMMIPPWIVVCLTICVALYAFPYIANYTDSFKNTVTKSVIMGAGALPTTVMLTVIHAVVIDIMLSKNTVQIVLGSLLLFIGCGCIALLSSVFIRRVFKKFLVVEGEEEEEAAEETAEETAGEVPAEAAEEVETPEEAESAE